MHAEKSGHDNHHDDHADNIEDTHGCAPVETFRTRQYPDASTRIFLRKHECQVRGGQQRLALPPAIAVIAAATEQQ
jgi:hypothetical protein